MGREFVLQLDLAFTNSKWGRPAAKKVFLPQLQWATVASCSILSWQSPDWNCGRIEKWDHAHTMLKMSGPKTAWAKGEREREANTEVEWKLTVGQSWWTQSDHWCSSSPHTSLGTAHSLLPEWLTETSGKHPYMIKNIARSACRVPTVPLMLVEWLPYPVCGEEMAENYETLSYPPPPMDKNSCYNNGCHGNMHTPLQHSIWRHMHATTTKCKND